MILVRLRSQIRVHMEKIYQDQLGRVQIVKVGFDNREFLLVNVYAPNSDDPEFFTETFRQILNAQIPEMLLIGDFNLVLDPNLDRIDKRQYAPKAVRVIKEFMENLELEDIWRIKNPTMKQMSWHRRKPYSSQKTGSRINFALVCTPLTNVVDKIKYSYGHKTDHGMLTLELLQKKNVRGPGYWKFNRQLLHDKQFVKKANKIIERAEEKLQPSTPDNIFEWCIHDLTSWVKKKSRINAQKRKERFQYLLHKLDETNALKEKNRGKTAHSRYCLL